MGDGGIIYKEILGHFRSILVAQELNNTHIKLALFRLLFTNKWVIYLDKIPIYWLD